MDGVDCSTCEYDTNEYNPRCVECMTTLKHHYQPKKEEIEKMFVELPDSGDRRDFGTGAVRDMGNKGRCDLLLFHFLSDKQEGPFYPSLYLIDALTLISVNPANGSACDVRA